MTTLSNFVIVSVYGNQDEVPSGTIFHEIYVSLSVTSSISWVINPFLKMSVMRWNFVRAVTHLSDIILPYKHNAQDGINVILVLIHYFLRNVIGLGTH